MDWLKTNAIAVVALFFSGAAAYASLENRIGYLESQAGESGKVEHRMDRQLDRVEGGMKEMQEDIRQIRTFIMGMSR